MKNVVSLFSLGEFRRLSGLVSRRDEAGISTILSSFRRCKLFFENSDGDVKAKALLVAGELMSNYREFKWVFQNSEGKLKEEAYLAERNSAYTFLQCKEVFEQKGIRPDLELMDRALHLATRFKQFVWIFERSEGNIKNNALLRAALLMRKHEHYRWVYENAEDQALKEKALDLASDTLITFDDCFWAHKVGKGISRVNRKVVDKIKSLLSENKTMYYC